MTSNPTCPFDTVEIVNTPQNQYTLEWSDNKISLIVDKAPESGTEVVQIRATAMGGAFIESTIEIVILELENTEVSMMDIMASVAEFTQEVGDLYFEFSFNLASFNTSFVNIESQLPSVSFGTIQIELGNGTDA
jgi:hypothetical protein